MNKIFEDYNGKRTEFIEVYKDKNKIHLRAFSSNRLLYDEKEFQNYANSMARRLKNRYEKENKAMKVTNIDFTNIKSTNERIEFEVTIKYM